MSEAAEKPYRKKTGSRKGLVPGNEGRLANLGVQPFTPTEEQRTCVSLLAGMRLSPQELANVVVNPETKKPISLSTLYKHFAHELKTGPEFLKSHVGMQYFRKLEAGEWPAINWGLKHIMGYRDDDTRLGVGIKTADDDIRIEFVLPDKEG